MIDFYLREHATPFNVGHRERFTGRLRRKIRLMNDLRKATRTLEGFPGKASTRFTGFFFVTCDKLF